MASCILRSYKLEIQTVGLPFAANSELKMEKVQRLVWGWHHTPLSSGVGSPHCRRPPPPFGFLACTASTPRMGRKSVAMDGATFAFASYLHFPFNSISLSLPPFPYSNVSLMPFRCPRGNTFCQKGVNKSEMHCNLFRGGESCKNRRTMDFSVIKTPENNVQCRHDEN